MRQRRAKRFGDQLSEIFKQAGLLSEDFQFGISLLFPDGLTVQILNKEEAQKVVDALAPLNPMIVEGEGADNVDAIVKVGAKPPAF